ncbi:hypothetical protein B0H19DRAFT_1256238 [Mycena capillaripes]|nr:hypothetical protein B0H19DRAFT_1256238 [Mycena capillaripes]
MRTRIFLDKHFLTDGFRISALSEAGYSAAYLQIQQALIIEDITRRAHTLKPGEVSVDDVAAWAGIKPATYANNRTFATDARATLTFLRNRTAAEVSEQSQDVREKESQLVLFLRRFFCVELISPDWATAQSSPDLQAVGAATVTEVRARIDPYRSYWTAFKLRIFTTY